MIGDPLSGFKDFGGVCDGFWLVRWGRCSWFWALLQKISTFLLVRWFLMRIYVSDHYTFPPASLIYYYQLFSLPRVQKANFFVLLQLQHIWNLVQIFASLLW